MKTADFDYDLPPEMIAQHPPARREDARLLVLDRKTGWIEHTLFPRIGDYLRAGDLLVFNDARVIPARLLGKKVSTGGKAEVLLLQEESPRHWKALIRPARRTRPGTEVDFGAGLRATVTEKKAGGEVVLTFSGESDIMKGIEKVGYPPLPPYIKRDLGDYPADLKKKDSERYQTVYARHPGAVAAPTAGFHFTFDILESIRQRGVETTSITLSVGYGTFQPVKTKQVEEHRMHSEYYEIGPEAAARINNRRRARLWVVGTTTIRALESAADAEGKVRAASGETDMFIYPGYRFKLDFNLITNFHLPRSTLIMLVSALAGREKIMRAYAEAIRKRYRFYSFGDAMLIL